MLSISKLNNGLVLIVDEMPYVSSVSFELMMPGGVLYDAEDKLGAALVLTEMTTRGAAELDSRALLESFDSHGIRHSEGAGLERVSYRGSALVEELPHALSLVSKMVLEPHLPEDELESVKNLFIQDLRSLDDNPSLRAIISLNDRYYPKPFNRTSYGSLDGLENTDLDSVRALFERAYKPNGAVLSVAGNVKAAEVHDLAERYFGKWQGDALTKPDYLVEAPSAYHHIESDSAQLQIVLAAKGTKISDPDYYTSKVFVTILSGGMFGRLFVEVREKLGLCYTVYARNISAKEYGTILAYAGTTTERADKTLEVMLQVLRSVKGTITTEELDRAKANYLSECVMAEETCSSRASSNLGDWLLLGRVRTLDEISEAINSVTIQDLDGYAAGHEFRNNTILTLGSRRLDHIE